MPFFVMRDKTSGDYLRGQSIEQRGALDQGVAIYRSLKAATKGAKTAIEQWNRLRPHWINSESPETRKQYEHPFSGIEIVELKVSCGKICEVVE